MRTSDFLLKECNVVAGRATLSFDKDKKPRERFRLRRFALPDECLRGRTLDEWYRTNASEDYRPVSSVRVEIHGHEGAQFAAHPRPAKLRLRMKARGRRGLALTWKCDGEERLYCAEWEGDPAAPDPKFDDRVECANGSP